jgi:hypothetical protein
MQQLPARGAVQGRVVLFVPRWIPEGVSISGLPHAVFPVLSSLARNGFEVRFLTEVEDGLDPPGLAGALDGADAAVAWCAELNPGAQVRGLLHFLRRAREARPDLPRLAGGGFFHLLPPRLRELAPLADETLADSGIGSLARAIAARLGRDGPRAPEAFDSWALRELDLRSYLRTESMLFQTDEPSLQVPTGYGCARRCDFCYHDKSGVRHLPAGELVDLLVALAARYGVRQFLFAELDFLQHRRRALAVARGLVERAPGLRWFALVSAEDVAALDDGELELFARSGCHALEIGTEVGSEAGARRIGKPYCGDVAERESRRLLDHGIRPLHNILLGHPGESRADRRATLDLVDRLHRLDPRVRFNFRLYQAIPGTGIGEEALRHLPPLPDTVEGLAGWRDRPAARALPWLAEPEEREVRVLIEYLLPLGYDDARAARPGPTRRLLRGLARARCRRGVYGGLVDRALFRRLERIPLPGTWLP